MSSWIGRAAAMAVVVASFAFATPASATHYTCDGFNDPNCNVRYFNDHQVSPRVDRVEDQLEQLCYRGGSSFSFTCISELANSLIPEPVHAVLGTAYETVTIVEDKIASITCRYFGACS